MGRENYRIKGRVAILHGHVTFWEHLECYKEELNNAATTHCFVPLNYEILSIFYSMLLQATCEATRLALAVTILLLKHLIPKAIPKSIG